MEKHNRKNWNRYNLLEKVKQYLILYLLSGTETVTMTDSWLVQRVKIMNILCRNAACVPFCDTCITYLIFSRYQFICNLFSYGRDNFSFSWKYKLVKNKS